MKSNATKLKLRIFGILMLLLPLGAMAQTSTVVAYLCDNATVTLKPDFGTYVYKVGDQVIWTDVTTSTHTTVVKTYVAGDATSVNFTTPAGLGVGANSFTVHLKPLDVNQCSSDPSDNMGVVKLAPPTVTLAGLPSTLCTGVSDTKTVTATGTGTVAGTATLAYAWTVKDGTTTLTGSALSAVGTGSGNTFTLAANVPVASYTITAAVSYAVTDGAPILPAGSCVASADHLIAITAKPTKPTVSIVP